MRRWLVRWFVYRHLSHGARRAAWCLGVAYLLSGRSAPFQKAAVDYQRYFDDE